MERSPNIWRVNRKPRFTVLDMGEYMAADDGPRETLLRNMKFERLARTLSYSDLYRAVESFLASPTRDRRILAKFRESVERRLTETVNATVAEGLTYQLRALEAFERSLNAMDIGSVTLERVGNTVPLMIEGVKVSVRPTVYVRQARPRSADLRGVLVIDLAKGTAPKTDEAQARLTNAMTHSAVLAHQFSETIFEAAGEKASKDHSAIFHTHRQEWITTPSSHRIMVRNIEAVCRSVARQWPTISPPPNFDASRTTYRD